MTLKQMIARVMRALPSMPPGAIGENDIIDILNQAQKHLSRISSKLKVSEFDLDANYNIVPLPLDLLTLDSVFWKSTSVDRELYPEKDSLPLGIEDTTVSDPYRYYTKGSRIMVYPIPGVDATVSISYIPIPAEMYNDDDTPDLEGSEEYMIAYTLHRLHMESASPLMQLWEAEKAKEEFTFLQTTDQNYRTPFQVDINW